MNDASLNTVYIISKGRPMCTTAQTLERIGFPGEWFIVCGDNDPEIPAYEAMWGDRVLVFDWNAELEHTLVHDNFGFEALGSGAVPARNVTARISRDRGEVRHWQFDDDYWGFQRNVNAKKSTAITGPELYALMKEVSQFGHTCKLPNVGFGMSTIENSPGMAYKFSKRVFNGHNLPSLGGLWVPWESRMNDDLINAFHAYRKKLLPEISFRHFNLVMKVVGTATGGNMEIYKNVNSGMVRKVAYAILHEPHNVKLDPSSSVGRVHHRVDWQNIVPKLISGKYDTK